MSIGGGEVSRGRRGRFYIVIGAVLAVLAFATAAGLASLPLLQSTTGGTRIVVAAHDIKARTVIQSSDLVLMNYNPAPPQAYLAVRDVAGKGARVDIPANQPITANLVAPSGDLLSTSDSAFLPIPSGYEAVTVPTNELVGVGGYPTVGDRITMLAPINTAAFGQSPGLPVVRTVFHDLDIIRVGAAGGSQTGQTVSSSLTLLMTSCDSEYLVWLLNNAQLKYELESFNDYSSTPSEPDPSCPSVLAAKGVGPAQVNARWGFTKL